MFNESILTVENIYSIQIFNEQNTQENTDLLKFSIFKLQLRIKMGFENYTILFIRINLHSTKSSHYLQQKNKFNQKVIETKLIKSFYHLIELEEQQQNHLLLSTQTLNSFSTLVMRLNWDFYLITYNLLITKNNENFLLKTLTLTKQKYLLLIITLKIKSTKDFDKNKVYILRVLFQDQLEILCQRYFYQHFNKHLNFINMDNHTASDFQSQYNIVSKNVFVGCLMEEQVKKIKIYKLARLQVIGTFNSSQVPQKICEAILFNSQTFLKQYAYIGNVKYLIQCTSKSLEELQELLIVQFEQQKKPLKEIELILTTCR